MAEQAADILSPETEEIVISQLTALAQSTRLNIFRELVKTCDTDPNKTGLAAGELARRMSLPAPTLSFHIKELARAGLVTSRKEGRSIIYAANLTSIRGLIEFLLEDCCREGSC